MTTEAPDHARARVIAPIAFALVIRPEQRYLAVRFGEAYAACMQRVRRWI